MALVKVIVPRYYSANAFIDDKSQDSSYIVLAAHKHPSQTASRDTQRYYWVALAQAKRQHLKSIVDKNNPKRPHRKGIERAVTDVIGRVNMQDARQQSPGADMPGRE